LFVIKTHDGDIVLTGVQQGLRFTGALVEEAKACLSGTSAVRDHGICCLEVEVDCLLLIQKLRNKVIDDNRLGLIVKDIFFLLIEYFDFIVSSFVKGEGNRVAHELVHWQPWCHEKRVWVDDVPDRILS